MRLALIFLLTVLANIAFVASPVAAAPPTNDDITTPTVISSLPYTNTQTDTFEATSAAGDPNPSCDFFNPGISNTVWYNFIASGTGVVIVDTTGTGPLDPDGGGPSDTVLAIYTGTPGSLTEVACNDNSDASLNSKVAVPVTTGTTYTILVANADINPVAEAVTLVLNVSTVVPPPANDDIATPTIIASLPYTNTQTDQAAATVAGSDPNPSCESGNQGVSNTVWYTFTAPGTGVVTIDTIGTGPETGPTGPGDTVLVVYTGTPGSLAEVACNDNIPGGGNGNSRVLISATTGTTYTILVANNGATPVEQAVTLVLNVSAVVPPPANDDVANATAIASLPYTNTQTNQLAATAGGSDPNPSCERGNQGISNTVWYSFTAPSNLALAVDTIGSGPETGGGPGDTVLVIYTGTPGSLTEMACSDNVNSSRSNSRVLISVTAGTTYTILVANFSTAPLTAAGTLVLNVAAIVSPANDNVANATVIATLPYTNTQTDMANATVAAGDPNPSCRVGVSNTVWYSFTAPSTGALVIDTDGTGPETGLNGGPDDTALAVYTGTPGSLAEVACSNDIGVSDLNSRVLIPVTAGTTYTILVANSDTNPVAEAVTLVLNVTEGPPPPANDESANATVIASLPYTNTQTDTANATSAGSDPNPSCERSNAGISNTVWYTFTTPSTGGVEIDTVGTGPVSPDGGGPSDTVLAVYTGTPGSLTEVACNDNAPPGGGISKLAVPVTIGTTYTILVANWNSTPVGEAVSLVLNVSAVVVPPPANDDIANATIISNFPYTNTQTDQIGATVAGSDPNPSCESSNAGVSFTVWYTFTASATGIVSIDTLGSGPFDGSDGFFEVVTVFTGTPGSLTEVGCGAFQINSLNVTSGTTYYVMIGNHNSFPIWEQGNLVVNMLAVVPPPANDDIANATVITSFPHSETRTDQFYASLAGSDPNPSCEDSNAGVSNTLWYTFTAPSSGTMTVDTDGSLPGPTRGDPTDTVLAVYTGMPGSLTEVACNDNTPTSVAFNNSVISMSVTAGTQYYIMVANYNSAAMTQIGNLVFHVYAPVVPPSNDNIANATVIGSLPYTNTQHDQLVATMEATDPDPSCVTFGGGVSNTVWYAFTPSVTGFVSLDTEGSAPETPSGAPGDTLVAVYTGTPGSLTEVACNDDRNGSIGDLNARAGLVVSAGTHYYVMVANHSAVPLVQAGTLILNVSAPLPPPANDDIANATVISSLPNTYTQLDQAAATKAASDPEPSCEDSNAGISNSVWYTYTPPVAGWVGVDTIGSVPTSGNLAPRGFPGDTVVAVYTGTPGSLTEIACNDNRNAGNFDYESFLGTYLEGGMTYFVLVANYNATPMSFAGTLAVNFTAFIPRPANDDIANATVITSGFQDVLTNQVAARAAGSDPDPSCEDSSAGVSNTIWYTFTAMGNGVVTIDTAGSGPIINHEDGAPDDTLLAVYTGAPGSLTEIACNDDASTDPGIFDHSSRIADLSITAGTTYYVMAANYNATPMTAQGTLFVNIIGTGFSPPPPDDLIESATQILSLPYNIIRLDQIEATLSLGDPITTCVNELFGVSNTLWYSFVPPRTGLVTIDTLGTGPIFPVVTSEPPEDTVLGVFIGTPGSLSEIGCNNEASPMTSNSVISDLVVNGGTHYYIMVAQGSAAPMTVNNNLLFNVSDVVVPVMSLTPATPDVTEGESTVITLARAGSSAFTSYALDVTLEITPGAGTTTADYTISGGSISGQSGTVTVTIPTGQASVELTITTPEDVMADGNKGLTLALVDEANYDLGTPDTSAVTIQDDETAGISATPDGELLTTESGGTATFEVVLASQPTADVMIAVASSDTSEGTALPASLTFTPADWDQSQTVTVTGVDDSDADGPVTYHVTLTPSGSDALYAALPPVDVGVTNTDNDMAGITANPTGGLVTTEAGDTTTFEVMLNTQPTADVRIALTSSDDTEGMAAPDTLTFTPADWDQPQTATVIGADDLEVDGQVVYAITLTPSSSDGAYAVLAPVEVGVTNTDNDSAGITANPDGGLVTTEGSDTDTFTVVLNTQPTADVMIAVASSDTSEGTVLPASLTFTPADWDQSQTVTVTGVDDSDADGPVTYHVTLTPSGDVAYAALPPIEVDATNSDDEMAGITVDPTSGLRTTEAGDTDSFTVVLNTQPTADVMISLSSSDPTEGTVSPTSLTFTPANWDTPQTVTVTGVGDNSDDGNVSYTIVTAAAVSIDPNYDGVEVANVSVINVGHEPDEEDEESPPPPAPVIPIETFLVDNLAQQTGNAITGQGGIGNIAANGQSGNTFAHVIAVDGQYVSNPGEIGHPEITDMGVVQAVDVFGLLPGGVSATQFNSPVTICLRGSGQIYFISAVDNSVTLLPATQNGDYFCVTLWSAGKVILVGMVNPNAALPQDQPAQQTTGERMTVSDCAVTTTDAPLNLRAEATTNSADLDNLPFGLTLVATEYVPGNPGWYRVIYEDGQGWLREDFLDTSGDDCPS